MSLESGIGIFFSILGLVLAVVVPFLAENSDEVCERLIRFWVRILPRASRDYWQDSWIAECQELKIRGLNNSTPKNLTRIFFSVDIGRIAISEAFLFHQGSISKRLFDVILASIVLLFYFPLLIAAATIVRLQNGSPAILRQRRRGRNGRYFHIYQIRTMVPDADKKLARFLNADAFARKEWNETRRLTRDPRYSATGRFLHQSGFAALPQLVNVIRGDMSLVGPKPISADEECLYGNDLSIYDGVRPGMMGLHALDRDAKQSITELMSLNRRYILFQSLNSDIRILIRFIPKLLIGQI